MAVNIYKRRRTIEIYFILYLSALIFLLPDKPKDNMDLEKDNIDYHFPFFLQIDKTILSCKIIRDNANNRIFSFDSVNNIYYSGNVKNVSFEFYIEDQITKNKLVLNTYNNSTSQSFQVFENTNNKSASFLWKPELNNLTEKTYIVKVIASATPINYGEFTKENNSLNTNKIIKRETKFILAVNYIDNNTLNSLSNNNSYSTTDSIYNEIIQKQLVNQNQFSGNLYLLARQSVIKSFAYQKWSNQIIVAGVDLLNGLEKKPNLEIIRNPNDNKGSAYIADISKNEVFINGTVPASGRMNIRLSITRKIDKKEASYDFEVVPQPLFPPEFESEMYPNIRYTINPNLPEMFGQDVQILIKEGNNIKYSNNDGSKFYLSPDLADTGKTFALERIINNNRIGQIYYIKILNYQNPQIIWIKTEKNDLVRIKTVSFGFIDNKENFVNSLEISGNAKWKEYYPNYNENKDNFKHYQYFEITPKNSNQDFNFSVRAVDSRGKKSDLKHNNN